MLRIHNCISCKNYSQLSAEVSYVSQQYRLIEDELLPHNKFILQCHIKDALFITGRYNECLKWIKKIKENAIAGVFARQKLCNLFTEWFVLIEQRATLRKLKNAEQNVRYMAGQVFVDKKALGSFSVMLVLINAIISARHKTELTRGVNELKAFAVKIKESKERVLNNVISESCMREWLEHTQTPT